MLAAILFLVLQQSATLQSSTRSGWIAPGDSITTELLSVEPLSKDEQLELDAARAALQRTESLVRLNHGENVRRGYGLTTLECRLSRTTVEIRQTQVLKITTSGGGCY